MKESIKNCVVVSRNLNHLNNIKNIFANVFLLINNIIKFIKDFYERINTSFTKYFFNRNFKFNFKIEIELFESKNLNIFSDKFFNFLFDPYIFAGGIALSLSIIWWLKIINEVRLGIIYPLIHGGTILLTLICSIIFLRESITPSQITGVIFIVVGIVLLIKQ